MAGPTDAAGLTHADGPERFAPDLPTPPEVVARLDRVLAELTAPRRTGSGTGSSATRLSTARVERHARRRARAADLLVAAASVSVIALAGGAVARGGLGGLMGGSDMQASSEAAEGGGSSDTGASRGGLNSSDPGAAEDAAGAPRPGSVPSLRSDTLRRDVQRVLDGGLAAAREPAPGCARPASAAGSRLVAVRLDGSDASLLLGPVRDGRRTARVYSCDSVEPLARTAVEVP